jgi:hypothetical protein
VPAPWRQIQGGHVVQRRLDGASTPQQWIDGGRDRIYRRRRRRHVDGLGGSMDDLAGLIHVFLNLFIGFTEADI